MPAIYAWSGLTSEQWRTILDDDRLTTPQIWDILRVIYWTPDLRLNAKAIGEYLGVKWTQLNRMVPAFADRILAQYPALTPPIRSDGTIRKWNLIFDGDDGRPFYWVVKPEMYEALQSFPGMARPAGTRLIEPDLGPLTAREVSTIAKARIGQGSFRDRLLKKYSHRCAMCGIDMPELLVASHIHPWCESSGEEKGDHNNGLLLCAMHDILFDRHLISVDEKGDLLYSVKLSASTRATLALEGAKVALSAKMESYMNRHRQRFYQQEGQ